MKIIAKTLRMPENLSNALKNVASQNGLTLNSLILQILWEWVKKESNLQ